jgi:hypothetical protein
MTSTGLTGQSEKEFEYATENTGAAVDGHGRHWRVIYSEVAKAPFYYCIETRVGQFECPHKLQISPDRTSLSQVESRTSDGNGTTSQNFTDDTLVENTSAEDATVLYSVHSNSQLYCEEPESAVDCVPSGLRSARKSRTSKLSAAIHNALDSQESMESFSCEVSKFIKSRETHDSSVHNDNDCEEEEDDVIEFVGDRSSDTALTGRVSKSNGHKRKLDDSNANWVDEADHFMIRSNSEKTVSTKRHPNSSSAGSGARELSSASSIAAPLTWSCDICTFINQASVTSCEMCTYVPPHQKEKDKLAAKAVRDQFGMAITSQPTSSATGQSKKSTPYINGKNGSQSSLKAKATAKNPRRAK